MFKIEVRKGKQWDLVHVCGINESTRLIEDWKSKFTDLKPTKYGFRLTRNFLNDMVEGEVTKFEDGGETLRITMIS